MIQQNINQAISLAGFLFTQTPAYKKLGQQQELKSNLKATYLAGEEVVKGQTEPYSEDVAKYGEKVADIKQKMFENNPTAKTFKAAKESREAVEKYRKELGDYQEEQMKEEIAFEQNMEEAEAYNQEMEMMAMADRQLANKQAAKRETANRKKGYISPSVRTNLNRREKHQINTILQQEDKEIKKEEQRNG